MKHPKLPFTSARQLAGMIDTYFKYIEGDFHLEKNPEKAKTGETSTKIFDRQPEPATFAGLAYYLGFSSWQAFEEYSGKFAAQVQRARLRIEAEYEKKLHQQSPTAAIFVLKTVGWNERNERRETTDSTPKSLTVKVVESGPQPVNTEKEVVL